MLQIFPVELDSQPAVSQSGAHLYNGNVNIGRDGSLADFLHARRMMRYPGDIVGYCLSIEAVVSDSW